MTIKQSKTAIREDRLSYLWLAIGSILYVCGNGRWTIPLAAWLWPIFILRFMRTQKPVLGLIIAAIVFIAGAYIQWSGILMAPLSTSFILFSFMGIGLLLPFLFDGFIAPRLPGILSTLVFPLAWTTMEYLVSLGENGSWGSIAYTQFGNLPLQQIVSVTGIFGITFLMTWLAAVANTAWENGFEWPKISGAAGLYVCILALALLLGGVRLAFFSPDAKTVRVASIIPPAGENIVTLVTSKKSRTLPPLEETIAVMENLSRKGAFAGAKIVNWHEYSLRTPKRGEAALLDRARELALKENIYLLLAMGVFAEEPGSLVENKLVFIDPSGKVLWQYLKSHPVPRIEAPYVVHGEKKIPVVDTPFGKIASVICFDLDFPGFIRQAGESGADILFGPSEDWRALLSTHTQMTTFRAIENGFSLVRCTMDGLTMAVDHQGRTITAVDYFRTSEPVIISDVPMKGVATIYARFGDVFAWLCCAGFSVIVFHALVRHKKKRISLVRKTFRI